LPVSENRNPHHEDRPTQDGTNDQIGNLRLTRCNDAVVHFGFGRARQRFTKRPVRAEKLLSLRVVQDNRRSIDLEGCAHLPIERREIAVLQARGYRKDLEFRLDRADLAIYVPQKIFDLMLDVLFDLRPLIIDHAKDGEACKRDERQRGRDGEHREPCLNAEAAAPHE
jgi:hypothetical protein